jgi:sarcosine oxidase subunit alpha
LVGLLSEDGRTVIPEGTQLVEDPAAPVPVPMCGHVTSSYYSPCLEKPIALALVAAGQQRQGETVFASTPDGGGVPVRITSPVFYDAKGDRQNV